MVKGSNLRNLSAVLLSRELHYRSANHPILVTLVGLEPTYLPVRSRAFIQLNYRALTWSTGARLGAPVSVKANSTSRDVLPMGPWASKAGT